MTGAASEHVSRTLKGGEKMVKKIKSQSTVEYILLLAALVLAILYGITTVIAPRTQAQYDNSGSIMEKASQELATATGVGD